MIKKKFIKIVFLVTLAVSLQSNSNAADECFEGTSRAIFKFNMAFDDAILEPIAKGYNKLPEAIKAGTSNFTSNIGTLLSIPNNVLQGNFRQLGHSTASFVINSSVGILGFLNPAEKMIIDKKVEKKKGAIEKIAKRMLPQVRKAELSRLSNLNKESYDINADFEALYEGSCGTHTETPKVDVDAPKKKRFHQSNTS